MAFASLTTLSLAVAAFALGPVTDLHIVNKWVNLDGFGRYGVLAEGQFPGPLITATKVHSMTLVVLQYDELTYAALQGDKFRINVIDELTNSTMLKSTSIVSA